MNPVGKVQVYAIPTGVSIPVTIPGSPGQSDPNNVYELIAGQGRVASVTSGSATGSGSGSVVAANPQYGELPVVSEPQGASVAQNPQYGEIHRQNSVSNTYV